MTETTPAATFTPGDDLTKDQAEKLTARLKGTFTDTTLDLIATAYAGKVWKPLGFATWEAWCDEHLGIRLRLMKAQQEAVIKRLTESGASSRAVAAVLGISQSTASRAQRAVTQPAKEAAPSKATPPAQTPKANDVNAVADNAVTALTALLEALPQGSPAAVALAKQVQQTIAAIRKARGNSFIQPSEADALGAADKAQQKPARKAA